MKNSITLLAATTLIAACTSTAPVPPAALGNLDNATTPPTLATASQYRLGPGDKLRITVFGENDLSNEYQVGTEGVVSLSLIGRVKAQDLTISEFEKAVEEKLRDGYIKEPRVSVEVTNYRPIYIFGEVTNAGEYPYQAGMTILNAVAVAGGYSYRANTKIVFITRKGSDTPAQYAASQATIVMPGDIIRIPERFF